MFLFQYRIIVQKELVDKLIKVMNDMSDQDRKNIFEILSNTYCWFCGSEKLPCNCMKDE